MKTYAWYLALGALGAGTIAASTACTVTTVNTPDDSGATVMINDGGSAESSTADGEGPDTGVILEAATCNTTVTSGSAACDMCLQANCCQQVVACDTPDDAGVDDAGLSMCEKLIGCVSDCVSPPAGSNVDAGTTSSCFSTCGASYSTAEVNAANTLVSCTTASCASMCM
ncbi:MAG TPA: hypothetical protein VKU41_15870 [Polyangiaceae bacterium]|nr:hypothetical protein [Polyangiaceae bacterium]